MSNIEHHQDQIAHRHQEKQATTNELHYSENESQQTKNHQNYRQQKKSNNQDSNVFYVDDSLEFQNVEISRSADFTEFNASVDSKEQSKINNKVEQVEQYAKQEVKVQIKHQQKLQQSINISVQQSIDQLPLHQSSLDQPQQTSLQSQQVNQLNLQTKEIQIQKKVLFCQQVTQQIQVAIQQSFQIGHEQPHIQKSEQKCQQPGIQQKDEQKSQQHNQTNIEQKTNQTKSQQKAKQQISLQQQPKQQVDYAGMVSLKIFQQKINQALQHKLKGNQHFKNTQYEDAIKKYSEGLRLLDPKDFYGATHSECQKVAEVSASLLFNIGSCFFNLSIWRNADIYYTQTITIRPDHIKAIYKRALCRYQMHNYQSAMTDIKQAFSLDKGNAQIHSSYQKILIKYNQQVKKQQQGLKQISSRIFRSQSQKDLTNSQKIKQKKQEQQNQQNQLQINQAEDPSSLWDYAPLVLVAGVALYFGVKKFFK